MVFWYYHHTAIVIVLLPLVNQEHYRMFYKMHSKNFTKQTKSQMTSELYQLTCL